MSPVGDPRSLPAVKRVPHARDMMARDFAVVAPDALLGDVARVLLRRRVPGAAVVDAQGRFLGFVSTRGVLAALAEFLHDERPIGPVTAYLDPPAPQLGEEASLLRTIQLFGEVGADVPALPVLAGEGRLLGVVTRLDVVRAVMSYLGGERDNSPGTLYISALRKMDEGPRS